MQHGIWGGYEIINNELPENTTLQKELKRYLLDGNKFGLAKGCIEMR